MSSMLQRTIGILLLILITGFAKAGMDVPVLRVLDGTAGQVRKDSVVMVEDAKFFEPSYNSILIKPYLVRNMVSLEINEDALLTLQTNFKVTAKLQISKTNASGAVTVEQRDFTIRYDKLGSYASRATYVFENAYRVEVKVLSIDSGSTTGWNVSSVLKVVNQLQSFPKYTFDCSTNAVQQIFSDPAYTPGTTADEVRVWWAPMTGADEYDLEWAFVDIDALNDSLYGDPNNPNINLIFSNNASRVTISGTEYKVPLFYDGKGKLFFRVRSVQWQDVMGPEMGRIEANWSSQYANGTGKLSYNGHEQGLNWQSSITFAEDGKRKGVMQYFDGSLRSRQTVTKDNVSNKTIVTESMYDYQGRPVIQTLPVPTLSNVINYTRNFNRAVGKDDYDKSLFDTLISSIDYCGQTGLAMDVTSGASRYYSPSNDSANSSNPIYKYIPDAEGYPFTEVVYLQDGTGRVSRQSGVGKDFRIGSGHETKFYYGRPTQNELDALFGTEVGDETHYFKNMVRDANGQLSVSYLDMRGRTIATALAGDTLNTKLEKLSSRNSRWVTDVLSDSASNISNGLVMETKMALPVSKEGLHTFRYELSPQVLKLEGCDTTRLCYDCLYDLTITITDDCNNATFGGAPYVRSVKNFSLNNIDTSCINEKGFVDSIKLVLKPGVYQISKRLTLSKFAMDYYRDSVFMKKNSCKSIEDFVKEQRQIFLQSTQECEPTCSGCIDSLGTWDQFWAKYRTKTGIANADTANYREAALIAYANALEDCNQLCTTRNEFQELRSTMLADMTPPGGQYASEDTTRAYNIFGRDADALYKKVSGFKDGNGKLDSVYVPPGSLVQPQQLDVASFREHFRESWAETLLQLHPEYCKLQKLELIKASYDWDKRFEETEVYSIAKQKGYLNPTNNSSSPFSYFNGSGTIDPDPLASLLGNRFKAALENALIIFRTSDNKNYSMWGVAAATALCPNTSSACLLKYREGPALDTAIEVCDADRNMAWTMFRTLYLQAKKKIIDDWLNTECSAIPASALLSLGYQPRFASAEQMLGLGGITIPDNNTNPQDIKTGAEQKLQQTYDANCRAYVSIWLAQLSACKLYSQDDLNNIIIPQLIQVCKEGADLNHPMGSSSVKPGSTNQFKSFEEVIDNFNRNRNITSPDCNSYVITAPAAYDKQFVYNQKPLVAKPSDCECELITKYYYKYQNVKYSYSSFSDYMSKVYQTTISDTALSKLLGLCDGTYSCNFTEETMLLPAAFQCNTGEVCIDCDMFRKADSSFKARYQGVFPTGDLSTRDSTQKSWNTLYENFMNNQLGFSKTATEYMDFAYQCDGKWRTPGCDSLNKIVADFNIDRRNKFGVSYSIGTQEGFLFKNPVDFVKNGATVYPDSIRSKPGNSWNNFGCQANSGRRFCGTGGFAVEYRFKFLEAPISGGAFYTLAGSTGATFSRHNYWIEVNGKSFKGLLIEAFKGAGDTVDYGLGKNRGFDYIQVDTNWNVITDWCVLKCKVTPTRYQIYFNGRLVMDLERSASFTIPDFQGFGLGMRGRHGSVDWIKYYDANDQLQYFEDFNDPTSVTIPSTTTYCPAAMPDCRSSFTSFFNAKLGTNYTADQIDQLYYSKCGRALDVCGYLDSLKATQSRFNTSKPTKVTTILQSTGLTAPDSLLIDASRTYRDGALVWPGYIQAKSDTLFTNTSILAAPGIDLCTSQGFKIEGRIKLVENPFTGYGDVFSFTNTGNVKFVIARAANGLLLKELWVYNSSNVLVNALSSTIVLDANPNTIFSDWNDFKIAVAADSARFYFNGVKKIAVMNLRHSMVNSREFTYSFRSYKGAIDWIRIHDAKGNLVLNEDFNTVSGPAEISPGFICSAMPACQAGFVSYFNQQRNTNYNYRQIDSIYYVYTGRSLDICGTKDSMLAVIGRYNRDANPYRLRVNLFANENAWNNTPYMNLDIRDSIVGDGFLRWPDTCQTVRYRGWRGIQLSSRAGKICLPDGYSIEARINTLDDIWQKGEELFYFQDFNAGAVFYRRDLAVPDATHGYRLARVLSRAIAHPDSIRNEIISYQNITINSDPYYLKNKWSIGKFEVTKTRLRVYWDNVLIQDLPRTNVPILPLSFMTMYFYSFHGAVDWIKVRDHRGRMVFEDNFNSKSEAPLIDPNYICPKPTTDCNTSLKNYYNQQKGTNYTYAQIDSIYRAMTGNYLEACGITPNPQNSVKLCGRSKELFSSFDFSADYINNCTDSTYFITSKSQELYRIYLDSLRGKFDSSYRAKCLDAYKFEKFTVRHEVSEYHYTLYYYDQAGNLVKTVPPAGVNPNYDSVWLVNVKAARKAKTVLVPAHTLPTDYRYNTLNQVVAQKSPDGGMSKFWYDRLGRLTISQNAKQRYASSTEENRLYSYTKYDDIGRITEVGQMRNLATNGAMLDTITRTPSLLDTWMTALSQRREQITSTVYDLPYSGFVGVVDNRQLIVQRNLRNRVSYTTYTNGWNTANYNQGTFYTYDIHGNVDTLLQDYGCGTCGVPEVYNVMNQNGNRFKKISYNFDLISGKVNSVAYQKGWNDQFFHRYSYDGENRLTLVETSLDGYVWEKDARYQYYLHGPLARTILGNQQVQGIDYAYTLQGWLKGVNSVGATDSFDIGGDGKILSPNRYVARDAYGFALNYYDNEYKPINSNATAFPNYSGYLNTDFRPLYNGNISSMVSTNRIFENPALYPDSASLLFNYTYDQLNRITGMEVFNKFNRQQNKYDNLTKLTGKFKERVSYDANGNIQSYLRNTNGSDHG